MPDTIDTATATATATAGPEAFIQANQISKFFGSVNALRNVSLEVRRGTVTCVLGDNGAGKSTLIKILSGVFPPDEGDFLVDGRPVHFSSPRDAKAHGIATVYQDLAMVPLMSVWRNFFLGSEPTKGWGPWRRFDLDAAKAQTKEGLKAMGIDVRDPDQPVGTLSGGERQCVAIARAVHFGARVLILDEPTSALGVKQAGVVLRKIAQARDLGLGVVFITHNPHHAYPVGDRFVVLNRGRGMGDFAKAEIAREDLVRQMAGGAELEELGHELERLKLEPPPPTTTPSPPPSPPPTTTPSPPQSPPPTATPTTPTTTPRSVDGDVD